MKKITGFAFALLICISCQSNKPDQHKLNNPVKQKIKPNPQSRKTVDSLPDISGLYQSASGKEGISACDLSVKITKIKGQYFYQFNIAGEILKGKVTLRKTPGEKEMSIVFEGIKWAEYEGDVSSDTTDNVSPNPQPKLPVGVAGSLLNGEIIIQNYGNAMNYYVVFTACGEKFITLTRLTI
ncbi:hypothetical protein H7F33_06845 [Pedobacter sp. PAMC26386]|nr:hypothetical protein H7F33_06845 [Pedobacter sp. PAMC26386]